MVKPDLWSEDSGGFKSLTNGLRVIRPADARRIAERLTAIMGDMPFAVVPFSSDWLAAPAGEWHLTVDRGLRKGVGDLHA